jgi:hypothetical protein
MYFIHTGDPNTATKKAYPNAGTSARYQINYRNQQHFGVRLADLFRAIGVDESKIVEKTQQLLDAKRVTRTYRKGEMLEEVEEEDNFAISKGLDIAIAQTGHSPNQKILHGEDKDNPFQSVSSAFQAIMAGERKAQPPETKEQAKEQAKQKKE